MFATTHLLCSDVLSVSVPLSCLVLSKVAVEELRLPPILSFAAVETRSRDWANVITCHEGHSHAYVWKFDQRVIGQVHAQATMKELSTPCMRQGKVQNHDLSRAFDLQMIGGSLTSIDAET